MRKKRFDIDILISSTDTKRKIRFIYQNNEQTLHEDKEAEPVQPVHMNIHQSNSYRKLFSWIHFGDELRVQKRQPPIPYICFFNLPNTSKQQLVALVEKWQEHCMQACMVGLYR